MEVGKNRHYLLVDGMLLSFCLACVIDARDELHSGASVHVPANQIENHGVSLATRWPNKNVKKPWVELETNSHGPSHTKKKKKI